MIDKSKSFTISDFVILYSTDSLGSTDPSSFSFMFPVDSSFSSFAYLDFPKAYDIAVKYLIINFSKIVFSKSNIRPPSSASSSSPFISSSSPSLMVVIFFFEKRLLKNSVLYTRIIPTIKGDKQENKVIIIIKILYNGLSFAGFDKR